MSQSDPTEWKPMATAPRNGTRILVTIRASEQGPAEVDVVRWGTASHAVEPAWIATDSDAEAPIIYAGGELASWMPMPDALTGLQRPRITKSDYPPPDPGEIDGSSI